MACHKNYDLNISSDFATVNHTAYVLLWAPNCLLIPSFTEFRPRIFKECHNMTNTHKMGSPQISSGAFKIHLIWNVLLHILSIWQYFCRINGISICRPKYLLYHEGSNHLDLFKKGFGDAQRSILEP